MQVRNDKGQFIKEGVPWNKGIHTGIITRGPSGQKQTEEHKNKISKALKGKPKPTFTEEHRKNISKSKKGMKCPWVSARRKNSPPWNKGIKLSDDHRANLSKSHKGQRAYNKGICGEQSPSWKGGAKLSSARIRNKRRQKGFVLMTQKNPYNEPIEYHHIHPDLPYVVPCPKRIHKMFNGYEKNHYQNVNAMLGFRIET